MDSAMRYITRLGLVGALALGVVGLTACGLEPAPTEPEGQGEMLAQIPEGLSLLAFTPTDGPVAKTAGRDKYKDDEYDSEDDVELPEDDWDWVTVEDVGPRGGRLRIGEWGEKGEYLRVDLTVPRGALAAEETIAMAVMGWTLDELVIGFGPKGLDFLRSASLSIKLGKDQIDLGLSTLKAYHDGDEIPVTIKGSRKVEIQIEVPGFSRYSLGGGGAAKPIVGMAHAADPAASSTAFVVTSAFVDPVTCFVPVTGDPGVRTVTADIGPGGGKLVVDDTGGRPQDDLKVIFTVPPGALAETEPIVMTVEGDVLSGLVVGFQPCGVQFTPWAQLHYYLGTDRVDVPLDDLVAVHVLGEGIEEPIDTEIYHTGERKTVQLWLDVPGFSRYGLR